MFCRKIKLFAPKVLTVDFAVFLSKKYGQMKKTCSILSLTFLPFFLSAQSVLITPGAQSLNGFNPIQNQLNVYGNGLLVSPKFKLTDENPTDNVHIMACDDGGNSGPAGILKDPGGDADYAADVPNACNFSITSFDSEVIGFQLDFEVLDIEKVGDTLIISSLPSFEILGKITGDSLPKMLIVNTKAIIVSFKTDNDAKTGAGFALKWRAILKGETPINTQNYVGDGLVYDTYLSALWAGNHKLSNYINRGLNSTALGYYTNASASYSTALGFKSNATGSYSTAFGRNTEAVGSSSTALGYYTNALGSYSTAMRSNTTANNSYSTAMGYETKATGYSSTAMGEYTTSSAIRSAALGYHTKASGSYSTAMGTRASTNSYTGAMVLSDYVNNSGDSLKADAENRLLARFDNGYKFYTNNDLSASTVGMMALHNANSWSSISDSTRKENFIASNGENVLKSVSQMRIGTWNYKGQNLKKERHWGVMAQDFYRHFGKDAYGTIGNDTTIATADFDGVSFAAIKALEERTRELLIELDNEKRFSASLELTTEKLELRTEQHKQTIEELQEQVLSMRAESKSVRAESRTVQAESKALKEDFKELKEMLLKSVAVKEH